jgi:hypothetical protein
LYQPDGRLGVLNNSPQLIFSLVVELRNVTRQICFMELVTRNQGEAYPAQFWVFGASSATEYFMGTPYDLSHLTVVRTDLLKSALQEYGFPMNLVHISGNAISKL